MNSTSLKVVLTESWTMYDATTLEAVRVEPGTYAAHRAEVSVPQESAPVTWIVLDELHVGASERSLRELHLVILEEASEAHLLVEIESAQRVIAACAFTGEARAFYVLRVLKGMLTGMAALDGYATHESCFDAEITAAIAHLVEAIEKGQHDARTLF